MMRARCQPYAIFCERVVVYKHIHVEVDFSSAATQLRLRHLCRSINSPLCFGSEMDHVFQMADVMLPDWQVSKRRSIQKCQQRNSGAAFRFKHFVSVS